MKKLSDEQKKLLLNMLIEDVPFTQIRKNLGLGLSYNLKTLCEYLGHKYIKAYNLHINNFNKKDRALIESNTNSITNEEILTKEDFLKGMDFLVSKLAENKNTPLVEFNSKIKNNDDEVVEIVALPKVLPQRLQGENYVVKQTSVKVVDNVWQEFQQFIKSRKNYSSIEYLSLAILEFLEKYGTN